MPRITTLRNQGEIDDLFRHGQHRRGKTMKVVVRRRGEEGPPRALVVAGRRVGGAVVRNRVKRRLREAFRAILDSLPPGCDVAMIAYDGGAPFRDLYTELVSLLGRAGIPAGHAED